MKRRQFLEKTIVAGGGAVLVSKLPSYDIFKNSLYKSKKLGIALVGLGRYATGQLAPALQETKHCYLAGIVTGTSEKEDIWAKKYNIPKKNIYNYETFDSIADNKDIDIVYVVLPNNMHAEYTIRAAKAEKHVISEKPMATRVKDCQAMIDACAEAGKKLSIGYRLHFEPHHLKMMDLGQHKIYGEIEKLAAGFSFHLKDKTAWRLNKKMAGGGPLVDLGIYAQQGSIYTMGELPVAVSARNTTVNTDFFTDVEGSLEWQLIFPSGTRSFCRTSYEDSANFLSAEAKNGKFGLEPSFSYRGIKGTINGAPMNLPNVNQQALQMDAFALSIKKDKPSIVPGEMGLRDVYLIEKIYQAAKTGKEVSLKDIPRIVQKV